MDYESMDLKIGVFGGILGGVNASFWVRNGGDEGRVVSIMRVRQDRDA